MTALSGCRNETESFTLPFGGAFRWITQGMGAIARAYEGRRVLRELARSDDRMLKDIGLDRSDLRNAAAEPLYRDPTDLLAGHVSEVGPRRRARGRSFVATIDRGSGKAARCA